MKKLSCPRVPLNCKKFSNSYSPKDLCLFLSLNVVVAAQIKITFSPLSLICGDSYCSSGVASLLLKNVSSSFVTTLATSLVAQSTFNPPRASPVLSDRLTPETYAKVSAAFAPRRKAPSAAQHTDEAITILSNPEVPVTAVGAAGEAAHSTPSPPPQALPPSPRSLRFLPSSSLP